MSSMSLALIYDVLSGKGCKSGLSKHRGSTKAAHLPCLVFRGNLWKTPKGFNANANEKGIIKRGKEEDRHFKASCTALAWSWLSGHRPWCQPTALSAGHFCMNLAGFWLNLAGTILLGCFMTRQYVAAQRAARPC